MVMDGPKDVNGYPTWMGSTGANVQLDGSVSNVWIMVDGLLGRIRKLEQITISGGAGTKYLYAQHNAVGLVRVDGDSDTPPPAAANGSIGTDGSKYRLFEDLTVDFSTSDVKPGDLLAILGTGDNAEQYQIAVVAPGGNNNRLQIKGVFPAGAQASLNYTITDPLALTFGFDTTKVAAAGKLYIGEADWDTAAITAVRPLHFQDIFVGEWRAVDVSGGSPTFAESWNHRLFDDAIEVQVQVSQANDGTQAVEYLSSAQYNSTLAISNTLSLSAGDQTLSGAVTLSGTSLMAKSAKVKWTNTQVTVANAVSAVFYKDYAGADKQTGYVRVVVKKLRK